jgi:hypothetical protein
MNKPSLLSLLIGAVGLTSACVITSNDDGATGPTTDPTHGDTDHTSDPSTSGGDETSADGDETADESETAEDTEDTAADDTGTAAGCGWGPTGDPAVPEGYACGGDGEDPDQRFAIECPEDLVEGGECGELTGVGCCDAAGNVWFCLDDGNDQTLVKEDC